MGHHHSKPPSCGCQSQVSGEVCLNGSWFKPYLYNDGGQGVYFVMQFNFGYSNVVDCPLKKPPSTEPSPSSDEIVDSIADWYCYLLNSTLSMGNASTVNTFPGKVYVVSTVNNCQISYPDLVGPCNPANNTTWSNASAWCPFTSACDNVIFPKKPLPSSWPSDNLY
jgi:hypothetical protein